MQLFHRSAYLFVTYNFGLCISWAFTARGATIQVQLLGLSYPAGVSNFRSDPCSDSSKWIHALWFVIWSNPGRSASSMALAPIIFLFISGFLLALFLSKVVGIGEPGQTETHWIQFWEDKMHQFHLQTCEEILTSYSLWSPTFMFLLTLCWNCSYLDN